MNEIKGLEKEVKVGCEDAGKSNVRNYFQQRSNRLNWGVGFCEGGGDVLL